MTAEEYERRPEVKAALKLVRSHRELLKTAGWSSYANRLMEILGIPPGERKYEGGWQMPIEFMYAHKRAVAKWSKADAFGRIVLPAVNAGKVHLAGAELSGRFELMPILDVLEEIQLLYPTVMLDDLTKPGEGPFKVKDVLEGFRFALENEELDPAVRSFMQVPHWMWGMDNLGFVTVWAMPGDRPIALAFKEHEGGLPVGRPPFVE
jgi:hypothetical protein